MIDKYTGFNTEALKALSLRDKAVLLGQFAREFAQVAYNVFRQDENRTIPTIPFHVAKGNAKTGETKSISFLPIATCSEFACKTCGKEKGACYALKSLIYPNVCINLLHNTIWLYLIEIEDSDYYAPAFPLENYLRDYIESEIKGESIVRWHVAGDINSRVHLEFMSQIAYDLPTTTFYTYTKSYGILQGWLKDYGKLHSNLKILISDWCGENIPAQYPELASKNKVAYVDDGKTDYIPKNAFRCKGNGQSKDSAHTCATCGYMCAKGINVVFPLH